MNINIMCFMDKQLIVFAKAIADDTRQIILKHLCCNWLSVSDVVDLLGGKVKQPTVSHHLKLLEEAGLATLRQEGRHRFYTLNQERMTYCCGQLISTYAPDYAQQVINPEAIPVK